MKVKSYQLKDGCINNKTGEPAIKPEDERLDTVIDRDRLARVLQDRIGYMS